MTVFHDTYTGRRYELHGPRARILENALLQGAIRGGPFTRLAQRLVVDIEASFNETADAIAHLGEGGDPDRVASEPGRRSTQFSPHDSGGSPVVSSGSEDPHGQS